MSSSHTIWILALFRQSHALIIRASYKSVHKMFFLRILVSLCSPPLNNFVNFSKLEHWLQLMKVHPARVFSRLTVSPVTLRP